MKKLSDKPNILSQQAPLEDNKPTIELRIDDKGFIYSKHQNSNQHPLDDEEFAQFCQMLGCIALLEMKDTSRILH